MDRLDLDVRRNNWVIAVFAGIITGTQFLNLILGIPASFVFTVLGILYGVLVPAIWISNIRALRAKLAPYMKYFILVVIGVFWFKVLEIDPHMINIMSMFFYVAVMGVYQNRIVNFLTIISTLGVVFYYFETQGEVIFHTESYIDFLYFALTFVFVSITSFLQGMFNRRLQKDLDNQRLEALQAKESMENMLQAINSSLESLKEFQSNLTTTTSVVDHKAESVQDSLRSTLSAFAQQDASSKELADEVTESYSKLDHIVASIQEMNSNVESTKDATKGSSTHLNSLEQNLERFNHAIQDSARIMRALKEEMDSIEEIISTINSISSQTNILALNASIEAARAGENGKGFAVVANEVKALAEQTKASSESVADKLNSIRDRVTSTANTLLTAGSSIQQNREGMGEVKAIFSNIYEYMENFVIQTTGLQDFITDLHSMFQEVTAKVEENSNITNQNTQELKSTFDSITALKQSISDLVEGFNSLESKMNLLKVQ